MTPSEYWRECISQAADECGLELTPESAEHLAGAVEGAHENYGMAFYSPPAGDREADIRRDADKALSKLQASFDRYVENAETAIKRALAKHLNSDAIVSIGDGGSIYEHGGRTVELIP
jgi:hypothetical protein